MMVVLSLRHYKNVKNAYIIEHVRYIYVCVTESLCCTPETNIVNQLYFSLKQRIYQQCMSYSALQSKWRVEFSVIVGV